MAAVAIIAALAPKRVSPRPWGSHLLADEYQKDRLVRQLLGFAEDENASLRKLAAKIVPAHEVAAVKDEVTALRLACREKSSALFGLAKTATERRLTNAVAAALAELQLADDRALGQAVTESGRGDGALAESAGRLQALRAEVGMLIAWRVERIKDARTAVPSIESTSAWLLLAAGVIGLVFRASGKSWETSPGEEPARGLAFRRTVSGKT